MQQCVHSVMQDVALPFMLDPRMPQDTLYLVFEEDFRFDNVYDAKEERAALRRVVEGDADADTSSLPPTTTRSSKGNERRKGRYYEVPTKLPAQGNEPAAMSQKLLDIVRLCTHAKRSGCGDLMWMSWNPVSADGACRQPARLRGATTFVAVSYTGAEVMWSAMDTGKFTPGHFDARLKKWLYQSLPPGQDELAFGYLFPPMGNYAQHACSVDKYMEKQGGPPSFWYYNRVCPGTRVADDPKGRTKWWCRFS